MPQTLLKDLPYFLSRRTRVVNEELNAGGRYVLYWMCTAARVEDNPALDVARISAQNLGRPLLVYHGLSYKYPFASDRHHRFILEGARDVQLEMGRMGIPYVFHLERKGDPPRLKQLAEGAILVVTENLPTPPIRRWVSALSKSVNTGLWCVDTACLVSLEESRKVYKRAFAFRDSFESEREEALQTGYPELCHGQLKDLTTLPFESLELSGKSLGRLIAQCPIDHTIPPVRDTQGGLVAGKARWRAFKQQGLGSYHRRRNDAASPGVSRMSAYLHYGHVSPFQLAQDAWKKGGKGAEKYLDELLIWRELSYHWCDKVSDPGVWAALPAWARESLEAEAKTHREIRYSWEDLARGKTHDELWNLAQHSLLHHGELHNNLRMTWGKVIHNWTSSPRETLRWLIDLNHRYALDGRDPSSYGGLLWCLGLFDRPFKPPRPIFGMVRGRTTQGHANRLDTDAYERHIRRDGPETKVAIVGAGLGGLHCARTMLDHRYEVTVFDKGRRPGGRSNTRTSVHDANWQFDHGTPYFSWTDKRFKRLVLAWENAGILARWNPEIEPGFHDEDDGDALLFVGVNGNQELARHLASELEVHTSTRVAGVRKETSGWVVITDTEEFGPFDVLLFNVPGPQLEALWPKGFERPRVTEYRPIHTCLVRFSGPIDFKWDVIAAEDLGLSLAIRENSKPHRPTQEQWVLHSSAAWSEERMNLDRDQAALELLGAFRKLTGTKVAVVAHQGHFWRYGKTSGSTCEGAFWLKEAGLGACGDQWGAGVEGAVLSGALLAGTIMGEERDVTKERKKDLPGM